MTAALARAWQAPPSDPLECALGPFEEASPSLIEQRQLLRRVDRKFVLPAADVLPLIGALRDGYAVLATPAARCATYRSLYFDAPDLRCFHDHRRGRRLRHKIRIRHYPDREVSFLEVKTKRNELITDKHRLAIAYGGEQLAGAGRAFLREHVGQLADELHAVARVDYRRITLIGRDANERVTIDVDLELGMLDDTRRSLGQLAVLEVKQPRLLDSIVIQQLSAASHRERSLSKYIAAIALLRPEQRVNRLLPNLRVLERMRA